MRKYFGSRQFNGQLLKLAMPIMIQNVINSSLNFIDNLMVGQLGSAVIGGIAASNRFFAIMNSGTASITGTCGIFISQFYGANNEEKIKESFRIAIWISFLLMIPFLIGAWVFPNLIISFFIDDPQIIDVGVRYMRIMGFSYIPLCYSSAVGSAMRSIGKPKMPMTICGISVTIKLLLNFIFMFGAFGTVSYTHLLLVQNVLAEKFTDLTYSPNGLSQSRFDAAELYNHYTNYKSNDLIRARYQGRAFICSDVYINEVRSAGKTTVTVDIFKGHFFILDISRQIHSLTQVYPKVLIGNDNHSGGFFDDTPQTEKVKLESVEFNRQFVVYSEDGHEAFYLLTPKVMEILLDLKKRLDLSVSFYDNKLYVAVADENDPFEIKLHDTIDESLLRKLHRDCADLCEILNLINQIEWNT